MITARENKVPAVFMDCRDEPGNDVERVVVNGTWYYAAARGSQAFKRAAGDLEQLVDDQKLIEMPVEVHVIKDLPIPPGAVKNIEFVNRRPGMALEPFRSYWIDVHGPIAAEIPVLHRYEQNHVKASAYAGGDPVYDGLAVTWFASTDDMKRGTTSQAYIAARQDEPHFLPDGHLPIIITREHEIVPAEPRAGETAAR